MGVLCAGLACAAGSPALLCIGAADAVFSPFPGPYKMGSDGAHDDKHDGDDGNVLQHGLPAERILGAELLVGFVDKGNHNARKGKDNGQPADCGA